MEKAAEITAGAIVVHLGQRLLLALEDDAEMEIVAMNALTCILAGEPFEDAVKHLGADHPLLYLLSQFTKRLQTFLDS